MTCPNCGADFEGQYCSNCGQRAVHLRLTLHELLHEALHELSHVDNKLIRTVRLLLFAPGVLTREFFEGKRARSVTPIRLYLLTSLLFFGVIALLPPAKLHVSITKGDAQLQQAAEKMNRDPSILANAFATAFPKAMFILMPLFGAVVYAFYFRAERMYVPHLYFAVHYHAFVFVVFAVFEALSVFHTRVVGIIRIALFLTIIPYLGIALRRVYAGSGVLTIVKTAAIVLIYGFLIICTMAAIAYVTMRRVG